MLCDEGRGGKTAGRRAERRPNIGEPPRIAERPLQPQARDEGPVGRCADSSRSGLPARAGEQRRRSRARPGSATLPIVGRTYLSSTVAPASSSCALTWSASSWFTPSLTGCGSAVDEVLRLLQAEAGDRADDLDHLDLLLARAGEDDVERGLLLDRSAAAPPPPPGAATATGAAAVTPHSSSIFFFSSTSSSTVIFPSCSKNGVNSRHRSCLLIF